jgi:glycosyltransferase involved in cell wall biosynthesis
MRLLIYDTTNPNSFVTGAELLRNRNIEVITLTENHLLSESDPTYFNLPSLIRNIKEKLNNIKPSVIHVHGIRTPIAFWLFRISHKFKIPLVATLHSYKLLCPITFYVKQPDLIPCIKPYPNSDCTRCTTYEAIYRGNFLAPMFRIYMPHARSIYKQTNVLIAPSKKLHQLIKSIGFNNVIYIPNPVKIPKLSSIKKGNEQINVGYFGQLKEYKGVQLLPIIAKRFPDIKFHIAGWGPLLNQLVNVFAKYSNVVFHGYLQGERLHQYLMNLDIVLFPSICSEVCPGTVLEAFAYQKPVVCFDVGGQAELVKLSGGGLLAKPFSVNDLCSKVRILVSEPKKIAEIGLNGRNWVIKNCLPEKYCDALISLYQNIIH